MNKGLLYALCAVAGFGLGVLVSRPGPEPEPPARPAHVIHIPVDRQVMTFDSAALRAAIAKLHPDTVWLTKTEYLAKPETLTVIPPITGISGILIGKHIGDTTQIAGFHIEPDTLQAGAYTFSPWINSYVTPGPFAGAVVDENSIRVGWYAPPPICWDLKQKAKFGGEVAAGVELVRALLGRP